MSTPDLFIKIATEQVISARENVKFWTHEAERATGEFKAECERMRAWWADIEAHAQKSLNGYRGGLV